MQNISNGVICMLTKDCRSISVFACQLSFHQAACCHSVLVHQVAPLAAAI